MRNSTHQHTTHLQDRLTKLLIGRKVLDAWYADDGELVIQLSSGDGQPALVLTVMLDAEGNGPGALYCYESGPPGHERLTVIPGSANRQNE